ncbi:SRPBCC family protein [uncultured Planktosalinus sp.]|uniref:SRPBCC family protein n=1 Tax=uncultured Planktosalinus sp. TaxID=1810935 RepID=UPI0030DD3E28
MKFFKYLFFLLLIVFIGSALYFGTQDGKFTVSEQIEIIAPVQVVFNEVSDYKNWEDWGSWMKDESLKIHYPENTKGEGSFYSWESEKDGKGAMQTLSSHPHDSLIQKIIFDGALEDDGYLVNWKFNPNTNNQKTTVTWEMKGELGLKEKILFAIKKINIESRISEMYKKSLQNLDSVLQLKMNEYEINVSGLTQRSGGFYLYNSTASKQNEVSAKSAPMISQLKTFMIENNIPIDGSPFVAYLSWDEMNNSTIFSVGIPTTDRVILPDNSPAITGFMPTISAVKVTLTGKHNYLSEAYEAADKYLLDTGFNKDENLSIVEVYTTSLPEEPNPANWKTDIYIPVQQENIENNDLK